jgi:hypothetical protein
MNVFANGNGPDKISSVYTMLSNHSMNPEACAAALQLLSNLGVYDLQRTVACYFQHVDDGSSLTDDRRELTLLTLKSIKASGDFGLSSYSDIILDALFATDAVIVYEAIRILHGYQGEELIHGALELLSEKLCAMLEDGNLNTEDFLVASLICLLNQFEDQILLYEWLLEGFHCETDDVWSATSTILLGLISWEPERAKVVKQAIEERMQSHNPLQKLASAFTLCLCSDVSGLSVVMTEYIASKSLLKEQMQLIELRTSIDLASLRGAMGGFSAEQILSQVLSLLEQKELNLSELLEIERDCSHWLTLQSEEVVKLIVKNIVNEKSRVREYVVRRAFYGLSDEHQELKELLIFTAQYDPSVDVRLAAIEVMGEFERSSHLQGEKDVFSQFLFGLVAADQTPVEEASAAARALSAIMEEASLTRQRLRSQVLLLGHSQPLWRNTLANG